MTTIENSQPPGGKTSGGLLRAMAAPVASALILLFARAVTAVQAVWSSDGPPTRQCVYFANHSSHGDFILIWTVLPPRLRGMTRPVAGAEYWLRSWLTRFIGRDVFNAVLIERERATRTEDPIDRMAQTLDGGASLILFPEGTRNQGDDPLLPFKSGIYHLARSRPDIEFVPVWISNLNRVMPKGEFVPVPLICTVSFGRPLRLRDGETKEPFLDRARSALLSLSPHAGEIP